DHAIEECFPARGTRTFFGCLRLLEGVVDGDGGVGVCLASGDFEDFTEACFEEVAGSIPTSMAIWVGDQLFTLGYEHRAQQLRVDVSKRSSEPDVEEVRQV